MKDGTAFELDLYPRAGEVVVTLSKEILFDAFRALTAAQPGKTSAFKALHALGQQLDAARRVLYGHSELNALPLLQKALTNDDGSLRVFEDVQD